MDISAACTPPQHAPGLSKMQKAALRAMRDERASAIYLKGRWVWRQDVRNDEFDAQEVYDHYFPSTSGGG